MEPVQLQVICSDIWESTAQGEKVISRQSLPKGWSVDVGLGQFYDQAIDYACRSPSEPLPSTSSLWSRTAAFVGLRPLSPIRMRKWISESLITAMGSRPVLVQDRRWRFREASWSVCRTTTSCALNPGWRGLAGARERSPRRPDYALECEVHRGVQRQSSRPCGFGFTRGRRRLGWRYVREASTTDARLALVADMKKEIVGEPDLGVLIQACAKSGLAELCRRGVHGESRGSQPGHRDQRRA